MLKTWDGEAALRVVLGTILVAVASLVAIRFGRVHGVEMLVWPGDGIILALMLGPCRRTPYAMLVVGELAIFASTYLIFAGASAGLPEVLIDAAVMDLIVIGRVTVTYLLTRRLLGAMNPTLSSSLVSFLCAAAMSALLFGCLKTGVYAFEQHIGLAATLGEIQGRSALAAMLAMSVTATMAGYAILTPPLLVLSNKDLLHKWLAAPNPRSALIIAGLTVSMVVLFWQSRYPVLYLTPLILIAVAYTVDLFWLAIAVLISCGVMSAMFLAGHGPAYLVPGTSVERLLFMQMFLVIVAATTFPIAARIGEHVRLKASLIAARLEAEAANNAKSVFLATMSHEIRTPLNGVLGMAQVMAMGELPPAQRERLEVLHKAGEALLSLLNDVLDLAKIEAGKLTLETIEFDLGEVLGEAAQNYRPLAQAKGLTFAFDMGNAAGMYLGDPNRLRQIVNNLMSNALKFTTEGTVTLAASVDPQRLTLRVSDTGIGIPADKLPKLFVKFSQVDESTTRNFGGTGLGLSICRELAELMGGRIEAQSVEGRGTRFTVELSIPRLGERRASPAAAAPRAGVRAGPMRVLAAEDNATNRLVLKSLLEAADIDLTLVENGAQAVDAWRTQDWDVILMDVQMPVMDGPAATREIRRLEAVQRRARTPIVALTANTMAHQVADYLSAGMDAHLPKPIDCQRLFETLSSCIAQGQAAQRAAAAAPAPPRSALVGR